jgi:hypothetical protein
MSELMEEFGVLTLLIKSGLDLESTVPGKRLTEDLRISQLAETVEFGESILMIKSGLDLELVEIGYYLTVPSRTSLHDYESTHYKICFLALILSFPTLFKDGLIVTVCPNRK